MTWRLVLCAATVVAGLFSTGPAAADPAFVEAFQTALYQGQTASAESAARARLAAAPEDEQARFALGATQFLQAVERLGQSLHRLGLRSQYADPIGISGLPFLRLPVPQNPDPERVTYAALRAVLGAFVSDLAAAEATLAGVGADEIDLPLNIGLIRLDLNADGAGAGAGEEALWRIFATVAEFPWLDEAAAAKLLTDFDASDVPWLRAYCHLLMALAEFPLAHDWHEAFEASFHGVFARVDAPSGVLAAQDARLRAELAALGEPPEPDYDNYSAWLKTPEGQRFGEISRLEELLWWAGVADLIAFVHLSHWPVVEPERMQSVLAHLEAMVALSRENWRRILAETDDRAEWIPSPAQTGVLPGMRVNEDRVAGWHQFLDELEALLQGRKLLPHFRFTQGINLHRVFTEPRTFDPLLMIQGSGAVPYLEDGEVTDAETWDRILGLMGGGFLRYFVWFN